jgi:hypothetical protein
LDDLADITVPTPCTPYLHLVNLEATETHLDENKLKVMRSLSHWREFT